MVYLFHKICRRQAADGGEHPELDEPDEDARGHGTVCGQTDGCKEGAHYNIYQSYTTWQEYRQHLQEYHNSIYGKYGSKRHGNTHRPEYDDGHHCHRKPARHCPEGADDKGSLVLDQYLHGLMELAHYAAALHSIYMDMEYLLHIIDQGEYDSFQPIVRKADAEKCGIEE